MAFPAIHGVIRLNVSGVAVSLRCVLCRVKPAREETLDASMRHLLNELGRSALPSWHNKPAVSARRPLRGGSGLVVVRETETNRT